MARRPPPGATMTVSSATATTSPGPGPARRHSRPAPPASDYDVQFRIGPATFTTVDHPRRRRGSRCTTAAWPLVRRPGPGDGQPRQRGRLVRRDARLGALTPERAPPPVRRGQPHQRPDPRVRRADQAARAGRARPPGCRTRTSPRRTCSTRPGSSGCAGSASSRARAGSSRPPSTPGSPTGWASCTRPGCGPAPSTRACARPRRPDREPHPVRGARGRDAPDGRPAPRRRPRPVRPLLRRPRPRRLRRARPTRAGRPASGCPTRTCQQRIIEDELGPLMRGLRRAPGAVAGARRLRRWRDHRPALGLVPHLQAGAVRPDDAALGPLAAAAPLGRLHRRQPRLRPARRLPHRGHGRAGRCRTPAPLRVHLRAAA